MPLHAPDDNEEFDVESIAGSSGDELTDNLVTVWDGLLDRVSFGLPSELDTQVRSVVCPASMTRSEIRLRHAEAHEAVEAIKTMVRSLGAIEHARMVHARGLELNTRAGREKEKRRARLVFSIDTYNRARSALLALGALEDTSVDQFYPPLTIADTFRKDPSSRREVGDSRISDGALWRPLATPSLPKPDGEGSLRGLLPASATGTRRGISM